MTYLDDLPMTQHALSEIVKQAHALAVGLQHAAPPQVGVPSSVQYLFATSGQLQEKLSMINQIIETMGQ